MIGHSSDRTDRARAVAWLAAVIVPLVSSQLARLHQHDASGWIAWDYAGRLGALAVAAAIPSARAVAFRSEKSRISNLEVGLWIAGFLLIERISRPLRLSGNAMFPATVLGSYPRPSGWLYLFDLGLGLALVALSEEVVFRRGVGHVLHLWLSNRILIVLASSLVFGGYHWWSGAGNVMVAVLFGVGFMLMLLRSVALWPVVLAHDVVDVTAFA